MASRFAILVTAFVFLSRTLSLQLTGRRWDTADEEYFRQRQCNLLELGLFRDDSADRPGLIISGHGGSATRAFQKIVELGGTHYFGAVDPETRDSLAVHWSSAIDDYNRVLAATSSVGYELKDVEQGLREQVTSNVCRSLLMIDDMQQQDPLRPWLPRPWGLKEPRLRFLLPFYEKALGSSGYKFLHVTRDVRNIHQTNGEIVFPFSDARLAGQFQAVADQATGYGLELADDLRLIGMPVGLKDVHQRFNASLKVSPEQVEMLAQVAHTWAVTELTLKRTWEAQRPERYFHISGRKMDAPDKAKKTARQLALFLGMKEPDEDTVAEMATAFEPSSHAPGHWQLMNMIINLDGMETAREALREFDCDVGIRPD